MSYKFQRLREKLREAVATGELSGKLPGERILAERFRANAKTLGKALTDLAAEGVLERIIGRGTFVRGQVPAGDELGRWMVIHDPESPAAALVSALSMINSDIELLSSVENLRPSFLSQFSAVIDLSHRTPESFLRELTVRNMPIVLVNREPATLSLHAVIHDLPLSVMRLAREMLLSGHRRLGSVEMRHNRTISELLHRAVVQHGVDATLESCEPAEVKTLLNGDVTALICGCAEARTVMQTLCAAGDAASQRVSIAAVGCDNPPYPCSGYYLPPAKVADTVAGLLNRSKLVRPTVLWLAGAWFDGGTTRLSSSPTPLRAQPDGPAPGAVGVGLVS